MTSYALAETQVIYKTLSYCFIQNFNILNKKKFKNICVCYHYLILSIKSKNRNILKRPIFHKDPKVGNKLVKYSENKVLYILSNEFMINIDLKIPRDNEIGII